MAPSIDRRGRKRAGIAAQPLQLRRQRSKCLRVKPRTDAAAIDQLAPLELAEQQGPEVPALLVRQAIAADDELVLADALGLDPVEAAAGGVGRIRFLRDHALEVQPAGLRDHRLALAAD